MQSKHFIPLRFVLLIATLASGFLCAAADVDTSHATKAMALLRSNCISCHNAEKQKGGLDLSTRDLAIRGGDTGPALQPGNGPDSLMIKLLAAGADPHMPPKRQLLDRQITTLRAWVEAGAGWDLDTLNAVTTVELPDDFGPLPTGYEPTFAIALSPDEKTLAIGRGSRVFIHDLARKDRPAVQELSGHRDAVQSLAFSKDGRWLASGGFRTIIQWETAGWKETRRITHDLAGRVTAMAFTPDNKTLVAADSVAAQSGWLRCYEAATGDAGPSWQAHGDAVLDVDISADGKWLATGGADRLAKIWEWSTRKEAGVLERHQGHVLAVAFNPDGTWLATGSTDSDLKVWDVRTRQEVINVKIHPSAITGIQWAGDGKSLVTVCEDGLARVFNEFKVHGGSERSDGARERKLSGSEEVLHAVAITKDAKTIFGGADSGTVHVWGGDGKIAARLTVPKPGIAAVTKEAQ